MTQTTPTGPVHPLFDPERVLVVPGFGATPDDHWFRWLADELGAEGVATEVVRLPEPDAPVAAAWEATVGDALGAPDERTWVVAHSLGSITALRVLAGLARPWSLGGLVLVSGFAGQLASLPSLVEYLADDVDAERIASQIATRVVVRSDDDQIVPPAASDDLARRLRADVVTVPGAGHFIASDGATSLPVVRDVVLGGVPSRRSARPVA